MMAIDYANAGDGSFFGAGNAAPAFDYASGEMRIRAEHVFKQIGVNLL